MNEQERSEMLRSAAMMELRAGGLEVSSESYNTMPSDVHDILTRLLAQIENLQGELRYERELRMKSEAEARAAIERREEEYRLREEKLIRELGDIRKALATSGSDVAGLNRTIETLNKTIVSLRADKAAVIEMLQLERRNRYGSKSQKSTKKDSSKDKDNDETDRIAEKDDFDGTREKNADSDKSAEKQQTVQDGENTSAKQPTYAQLKAREERIGKKYTSMDAADERTHYSDLSKIPDDAQFVKFVNRTVFSEEVRIVKHNFQLVVYRWKGSLYTAYIPMEGEPELIEHVPGTHAAPDLMAHIVYDHFCLDVTNYRKVGWLGEHNMTLVRSTLGNWIGKAGEFCAKTISYLKDMALEKDSIVNCDETWCRVKIEAGYKKKYIWCLVNKKAGIAIYLYDNGSRSRKVLKGILKGRELRALQSDAYNVYMYLDGSLVDIDHLCCMAHARAKFIYAAEQGDEDAKFIVDQITRLYAREAVYRQYGYTPEQIKESRNDTDTIEIIGQIRSKLDALMADGHPPRGQLMEKAISYMDKFWNQLFLYRQNGEYEIDNSLAERAIRPLTRCRANSLFYGSSKSAETAACFHTIIETCRMQCKSVLAYFKKFFREICRGNHDYPNLLPMTIGI